jgi:hypothetical protein
MIHGEPHTGTKPETADTAKGMDLPNHHAPRPTRSAAVIPGEHVVGLVGLQEAVAGHVAEDPPSDRVLEALEETGGEGGGFVEAKVGVRAGGGGVRALRGGLDLLDLIPVWGRGDLSSSSSHAPKPSRSPGAGLSRCERQAKLRLTWGHHLQLTQGHHHPLTGIRHT